MKLLLFISSIMLCSVAYSQLSIEKLNSDSSVKQFIIQAKSNNNPESEWNNFNFIKWENEKLYPLSDSITNIQKWLKADINNDGKQDIIVSGALTYPWGNNFILLAFLSTDSAYRQINLMPIFGEIRPIYFKPIFINEKECFELIKVGAGYNWRSPQLVKDTIVFMFNDFVNYNKNPTHQTFDSLFFFTNYVWKPYNISYLTITNTGNMIYKKGAYSRDKEFNEYAVLSKQKLKEFEQLLNYVNPLSLRNDYTNAEDIECTHITIKYTDGTYKTINDYGSFGTYSLKALYNKCNEFIENTDWKK